MQDNTTKMTSKSSENATTTFETPVIDSFVSPSFSTSPNMIRDFSFSSLGFTLIESFANAIDFQNDFGTLDILRIHLFRMIFVMVMNIVGLWLLVERMVNEGKLIIRSFNLRGDVLMIKVIKLRWINDIDGLDHLLEYTPRTIPKSISVIYHIKENTVSVPPQIPKPYLDGNKKLVVPSNRAVSNAVSLRNEYFTRQRVFLAAEKLRLLNSMSRAIIWSCLIPEIEFINLYEPQGVLWGSNHHQEFFNIMTECVLDEFNTQLKCSKNEKHWVNKPPTITFSHHNSQSSCTINLNQVFTNDEWFDEVNDRQFTVNFVDKKIPQEPPQTTDLTIFPEFDYFQLLGYVSCSHKVTYLSRDESPFGFKAFITGFLTYSNQSA